MFNRKKWRRDNKDYILEYQRRWRKEHPDKVKEQGKRFSRNNPGRIHEYYLKKRKRAFSLISNNNPICVRCGCDDIRLLEINHKNGGGCKEGYTSILMNNILNGTRKINDLEILCKVCNAHHALEMKYGKLPYKITYKNKKGERKF